jgi:hypothetical protein
MLDLVYFFLLLLFAFLSGVEIEKWILYVSIIIQDDEGRKEWHKKKRTLHVTAIVCARTWW